MTQQPQTSQPPSEQRGGLFVAWRRGRRSAGGAGWHRLLRRRFLVGHGGAVVQVGTDEALAASDVVNATERWVSSVRQWETGLLLCDGVDTFVTEVSVQKLVAWVQHNTSLHQETITHPKQDWWPGGQAVRGLTFLSWRSSIQWWVAVSWGRHHRHGDRSRFTCNRSRWNGLNTEQRVGLLYRFVAGSRLFKSRMGVRADSQRANERCLRRTGTGRLLSESRQEFGDFGPTLTPGCTFESLLGGEEKRKVKNWRWSHPV